MRQITDIKEIQAILLEQLQAFDRLCRDNGLTYFLANGTLLGAAKYGSFVPWDDDVDILMPRESYDRLPLVFRETEISRLLCSATTPCWRLPYAKLTDCRTVLQEGDFDFGTELGLSVDIFPIDRWHPNRGVAAVQAVTCDVLKRMLICANGKTFSTEKRGIKKGILWCIWACGRLLGTRRLLKMIERRAKRSARYPARYAGCVAWTCHGSGEVLPAGLFDETRTLSFCGGRYPAPAGYEAYLSSLYGDWRRELPPENRKSNHRITVWRKHEE